MGKGKKPGDRPELFTTEEMDNLIISVAPKPFFYALYNTLKYTGRRIGEIYGTPRNKKFIGGLKVKDINFEEKTMKTQILKTKKRKLLVECEKCKRKISNKNTFCNFCGKKLTVIAASEIQYNAPEEKTIALNEKLIPILYNYIKLTKLRPNDFVFRDYSLVYLKKCIKKHTKLANIDKNFSLHGFRHYFITNCKISGMSNEDISKWTGHKNPQSMNVYDRRTYKDVEDQIFSIKL